MMPDSGIGQSDHDRTMEGNRLEVLRILKIFFLLETAVSVYLVGFLIVSLVSAMCIEVLRRWILGKSFIGLMELSELLAVVIAFTSLSCVQKADAHIKMELLSDRLAKRRAGRMVNSLNALAQVALFALITYVLGLYTLKAYQVGHTTPNVCLLIWPFFLTATLGSFVMLVRVGLGMKGKVFGNTEPNNETRT